LRTFAEIPDHLRRRINAGERVLLILLDAFGMVFLERHRTHPLIRRMQLTELSSQFPSTTTAHVTTLHFGVPVAEHGLYEWAVYEPTLDTIINPLPFRRAGEPGRESLAGALDPRCLLDAPTFYQSLSVPSAVIQPVGLELSSYSRLATAGATVRGDDDLAGGVRQLLDELADGSIGYAHLYWPDIDTASHDFGPDSPEVRAAIVHALDAIEAALQSAPSGVTVMITADHGQTAVSPHRLDLLDLEWTDLLGHLTQPRPAGSSRDLFLHVRPESVGRVIDELSARLEGRASVHRAAELFDATSPRLAARLADVAVLPVEGRGASLTTALPSPAQKNLGSHGGLTWAETATHLSELVT
jgi:hypothetical protein